MRPPNLRWKRLLFLLRLLRLLRLLFLLFLLRLLFRLFQLFLLFRPLLLFLLLPLCQRLSRRVRSQPLGLLPFRASWICFSWIPRSA